MVFSCKNIAAYLFIFSLSLIASGCAGVSVTSPETVEVNMRNLLETHSDVNEVRTVWSLKTADPSISDQRITATPLLAAILLEKNERVPKLIEEGASANVVAGSMFSPLGCAAYRDYCTRWFLKKSGNHGWDIDLPLMKLLLDNGADPNAPFHRGVHLMEPVLCKSFAVNGRYLGLTENSVKMLKLLSDHGASYDHKMIKRCRDVVENEAEGWVASGSRAELKKWKKWQKKLLFLDDLEKHGIEKALNMWEKPDRYFKVAKKRKESEKSERIYGEELAIKRSEAKKRATAAYIASNMVLRDALADIVQIGAEKKTVGWILQQNRFGARDCETRVGSEYFKSDACESNWEVLMARLKNHYSNLETTYRKQSNWFTGLFGKNAALVEAILGDRVANAQSVHETKRRYAPAFQQLRRITEAEASAERLARQRQEQQVMADFMNNIQNTLESTYRRLDRNMARTQQTINEAYTSQSIRDVSTSFGYQESNALAMRELNKKLDEIDQSFTANKSLPKVRSASTQPSHRVCGGPFAVSAMNKVFDITEINTGKAEPPVQCSKGGSPVMEGRYSLEGHHINWLIAPPNYKKEAILNDNGRPSGRYRVSWDAFSYECLCSINGGGEKSGGYQQ